MAEYTTSTTYTVNCPDCESAAVKKHGFQSGEQRYFCKVCKKAFRSNGKAQGRRMDAEMMGSAIQDYYTGRSYKQIAEGLEKEYDLDTEPSKATVYEWVRGYTDKAVKEMGNHKARTGGDWVADEMVVKVGGKNAYNWNVMDQDTRYILASYLSYRRDGHVARAVMQRAAEAADKPPKTITTDKWRAYIKPIRDIFPEAKHIQSEGLTAEVNNNLSERLQGTFRSRTKTLRGLEGIKSGQRYLDGWVLNYNLFRKHHSLDNKTPGEKAKVNPPFREWADVVKGEAALPMPVLKAEARPISQSPRRPLQRSAAPLKLKLPKARQGPKRPVRRKRAKNAHPMAALRREVQRAQRRRGMTGARR